MNKIKNWVMKNKALAIVVILAIVLFIMLVIIMVGLLVGGSSNKYGDRLDGIDEVLIDSKTYDEVKEEILGTDLVEDASIRLQGKIVYTTIILKSDTTSDKAKEIASNTLDNYSKEELSFYDYSFFLEWKGDDGNTVITGNKHHNLDAISWVKSQVMYYEKEK